MSLYYEEQWPNVGMWFQLIDPLQLRKISFSKKN